MSMRMKKLVQDKLSVFYNADTLGFVCGRLDTVSHKHFAIQLTIALDNPFSIQIAGEEPCKLSAALIPAEVTHRFTGFSGNHFFLLINPLGNLGLRLDCRPIMKNEFPRLPESLNKQIYGWASRIPSESDNEALYQKIMKLMDDWLIGLPERRLDERVHRAIKECRQSEEKKIPLKELARRAYISEGRLVHLFKQDTGVPIRRYLKWLRILDAITSIQDTNSSLTKVAHEVGFSDSAHFTRTFKEMFGIFPSLVFKK